jgi:siroheme synthase
LFQLPGISLTKKACQRVLGNNGTTSARKLSTDVALQRNHLPVVVLMGMSKLNEIVNFSKRGQRKPRCDYSKRNHSRGKKGIRTINLSKSFLNKKLSSPAIIVIGEVVR